MANIGRWKWVVAIMAIYITGCAHTTRPWGEATSPLPGWRAVGEAAKDAIADPHTWVPIIAAGVFASGDLDEDFTEWAVRKDLMFDNSKVAADYSDDWLEASKWLVYVSAMATPSGEEPGEWLINKAKGLTATAIIAQSAYSISSGAKKPFNRERPDGSNKNSFPSSHALRSSMWATMTARNIEAMALDIRAKRLLQGGAYTLAGATAWARLEANRHYPSDVLIGYSLGHFFGAFLNDAFITPITNGKIRITTEAAQDRWKLGLEGNFD